jgi:proteasome lid subunit RPN8/RPN11
VIGDWVICGAGVLEAIEQHARREAPDECCGLLIGSGARIDEAVAVENRAADPARRYEIDPGDFLAAIRRCRGTERAVIGAYHSHPRSAPEPSERDLAAAFADFVFVIAGPVAGDLPLQILAFCLEAGNFRSVRLVPDAEDSTT